MTIGLSGADGYALGGRLKQETIKQQYKHNEYKIREEI